MIKQELRILNVLKRNGLTVDREIIRKYVIGSRLERERLGFIKPQVQRERAA